MKKSLFKKYLAITMSIVFVGYFAFGTILLIFLNGYWVQDKKGSLVKTALSVSSLTSLVTEYNETTNTFEIDLSLMSYTLNTLTANNFSDIVISDLEGNRIYGIYSSSGYDNDDLPSIDQTAISSAIMGNFSSLGTFGDTYETDYYSVGVPITITLDNGELETIGAIFVSSDAESVNDFISSVFSMFIYSALLTLFFSFIFVWAFTYKITKPLSMMSKATKAFGEGDFSVRIPVDRVDEIGQLSVGLNNMASSLSNSEGMRRSFVANVSHELKTPMTTIGGFIDGILDGTISEDKQKYYLRIVSDEVKRLSRLVTSMLDLSKIDSGEMKLNPSVFNITGTVFTTVLTFEQKIEEKNLEIQGLEDVDTLMVNGDQGLLHQVIYNLVENAVKFTNNGGYIKFVVLDTFDRICVSIENSGYGIMSDDLPMIFDKFYKTDKSRSEDKNGMGLGLYLVKTIVNLHGGDISVHSELNQFTRFEFYLPKSQIEPPVKTSFDIQEVE